MVTVARIPAGEIVKTADHRVVLTNVPWSQYEAMLAFRGENSVPRMAYLDGELELMSPSRSHESINARIGRLVEVFCLHENIEFETVGSWTLKRPEKLRGAEADESYVFGDLNKDRPDLAIEVIWTSGGLNKLDIYNALGVPEVWFWKNERIEVYELQGEEYAAVPSSRLLPGLDLELLLSCLNEASTSASIRKFRAALEA